MIIWKKYVIFVVNFEKINISKKREGEDKDFVLRIIDYLYIYIIIYVYVYMYINYRFFLNNLLILCLKIYFKEIFINIEKYVFDKNGIMFYILFYDNILIIFLCSYIFFFVIFDGYIVFYCLDGL